MVNPWVLLGVAVMWGLSLLGVGKWQRADGRTAERVAWQQRDSDALRAANAKILTLNAAARRTEQESAATVAAIGEKHAAEIEALKVRGRRDVAAARDGTLKLRLAGACPQRPGGSASGEAAATPGRGDEAAPADIPAAAAGDLLQLAIDADEVVEQLTSCQSVVRAYFRAANGVPIPVPKFEKESDS